VQFKNTCYCIFQATKEEKVPKSDTKKPRVQEFQTPSGWIPFTEKSGECTVISDTLQALDFLCTASNYRAIRRVGEYILLVEEIYSEGREEFLGSEEYILERETFDCLLKNGYIQAANTCEFCELFLLSAKGRIFLSREKIHILLAA
jgi:hypothetical protein